MEWEGGWEGIDVVKGEAEEEVEPAVVEEAMERVAMECEEERVMEEVEAED